MTTVMKGQMDQSNSNAKWINQIFPLRGLAEFDVAHSIYVAYCLETGSVATGDDMETVKDMLREVLEDEVSRVMKSKNLANLFSTPAPFEIWEKWEELAKEKPNEIDTLILNLRVEENIRNAGQTTRQTAVAFRKAA